MDGSGFWDGVRGRWEAWGEEPSVLRRVLILLMVHVRQASSELHPQTRYVCPRVCACAGVTMCAGMLALPFPPTLPALPMAANP